MDTWVMGGWMQISCTLKKKEWSYYYYNAADNNDGEHNYFVFL